MDRCLLQMGPIRLTFRSLLSILTSGWRLRLGRNAFIFAGCSLIFGGSGVFSGSCAAEEIHEDQVFTAPNGTLAATFLGGAFEIKDTSTGRTFTVQSLTPVSKAIWTDDSKTLVTVEHLAGGSDVVLFQSAGAEWKRVSVDPVGGPYDRYTVTRCEVEKNLLKLAYRVRSNHAGEVKVQIVAFQFDPATAAISHVMITEDAK